MARASPGTPKSGARGDRRQAEQITAWLEPYNGDQGDLNRIYAGLRLKNASNQLVYDVIAEMVGLQGAMRDTAVGDTESRNIEFGARIGNLPPGETVFRINAGGNGMYIRFGIEIAFKDAAGRCWLRLGSGTLKRVYKHPVELYGLSKPLSWER